MSAKQWGLIFVLTIIIMYLLFELFVCVYGFIINAEIDEMPPPPVGYSLAVIILFLISPLYYIVYDIFNKKDK